MVRFDNGTDQFQLGLIEYGQTGSHADALLRLSASAHGFAGSCEAHFLLPDLLGFARSLQALQQGGEGSASLYSLSPHEVELHLAALDDGQLALRCSFGQPIEGSAGRQYWHALSFGFECAASQLPRALQADWLQGLLEQ